MNERTLRVIETYELKKKKINEHTSIAHNGSDGCGGESRGEWQENRYFMILSTKMNLIQTYYIFTRHLS